MLIGASTSEDTDDILVDKRYYNKRAQRALGRSPEEKVKGQVEAIILL